MKRLSATLYIAALLTVTATTMAEETLVLKNEAFVRGPRVLLGEVADIEGTLAPELESIELGTAALPGDSKRLNASLVEARIRSAGVDMSTVSVSGATSIRATTLHLEVSETMLAASLREFIELSMPWPLSDAQIDVFGTSRGFRVPEGEVTMDWQASPQYNYLGAGAFRGTVYVDGEPQKYISLKANVEAYGDVVVAARDIARGAPVAGNALTLEKRALSRIDRGAYTSVDQLEGFVARTNIFPGQEITNRKVEPRQLIKRNQMVSVEMRAGGLRVQTQARALSPAAAGDTIVCENTQSKAQFQGIVGPDGVVHVP
jgi:flagella basal body P-ring formation protein FlgA